MRKVIHLIGAADEVRDTCATIYREVCDLVAQGEAVRVQVQPKKLRSLCQNRLMWAVLRDVAEQVLWHGHALTAEEWKDMATASLKGQKVVPNFEGTGFIAVGGRTSEMTAAEMSDVIEFVQAFGSDRGVRWTAPAWMWKAAA